MSSWDEAAFNTHLRNELIKCKYIFHTPYISDPTPLQRLISSKLIVILNDIFCGGTNIINSCYELYIFKAILSSFPLRK